MQKTLLFFALLVSGTLMASDTVRLTRGTVPLHNVFEPDSLTGAVSTIYNVAPKIPTPGGIDPRVKYQANVQRQKLVSHPYPSVAGRKRAALPPMVISGFTGASNEGTPNDNNLAVSNDSIVISVLNTFIRVYRTNGTFMKNWSLELFPVDVNATKPGSGVGTLNRSYDPKVVYDPVSDRFIIVYLEGDASNDTRIIVGFSKTNNPLNGWNVYQLSGDPYGGKFWTDYPMIGINGEDLFITVNILKDSSDWRTGFTQSVIWQLPKKRGYQGDTLMFNLWSNIKHNGKPIWNICPVPDAYQPGHRGMYFLSVRPGDVSNDTVFLHSISDNFSSGSNAYYSYKVLKSDKKYGLPPSAPEKTPGFRLQTNDARVLGAFNVDNKIQFVLTSNNTVNGRSSVYHGIIQFPDNPQPSVTANIISYDSVDIAYPTIAHAGNGVFGRQSLITFSHSGENVFPGTSVVYYDNNGEYSDLVMARKGDGIINSFIPDTAERWGDYTCIQRRYNNSREFWLVGSYGKSSNTVGTWISRINMNDPKVEVQPVRLSESWSAFPNPVAGLLTIPFAISSGGEVKVEIHDATGKLVYTISEMQEKGNQKALINVSGLVQGIYFYTVTFNGQKIQDGSFSKQ